MGRRRAVSNHIYINNRFAGPLRRPIYPLNRHNQKQKYRNNISHRNNFEFLLKMLSAFEPASLRVATLLRKKSRMKINLPIDFIGFDIEDKYVIGYGLDDRQIKRNLRAIYIVNNDGD